MRPRKSFRLIGTDGVERRWSDRHDYATQAVEAGKIETIGAHTTAYDLHALQFIDWVTQGQTGCRFAAHLAREYEVMGWKSVVVTETIAQGKMADFVSDVLTAHVGTSEIVQIIFPHINDTSALTHMIDTLCLSDDRWYWEDIPSEDGSLQNVGLRWVLPDDRHVAWVVGFSNLDILPITRRGPFATLVVRTSTEKRVSNSNDKFGRVPVHLADMDDLLPNQKARDAFTESTKRAKVAHDDPATLHSARARITFAVPRGSLHSAPL